MDFRQLASELRMKVNRALNRIDKNSLRKYGEGKFLLIRVRLDMPSAQIQSLERADTEDLRQLVHDWLDTLDCYYLQKIREGKELVITVAEDRLPSFTWKDVPKEISLPTSPEFSLRETEK